MLPRLIDCLLKNGYDNALLQIKDGLLTIEHNDALLFFKLQWADNQAPITLSFFNSIDLSNIDSIQFESSQINLYSQNYEYSLNPESHRNYISCPKIKPLASPVYIDYIEDFLKDCVSYYVLDLQDYSKRFLDHTFTKIQGDFSFITCIECLCPIKDIREAKLTLCRKNRSSQYLHFEVNELYNFLIPVTVYIEDDYE